MDPTRAIDVLVEHSRRVSEGHVEAGAILERLVRVVVEHELADGAFVVSLPPDGGQLRVLQHGIQLDLETPDPEELGLGLEREVRACLPDLAAASTLPIVSGGGLFGTLVLAWTTHTPDQVTLELAEGLVDISSIALDRAFQTASLQRTVTELEESREALARKQKLEALGRMAAVVAHEVKNPLASVSGALQVLGSRMPSDSGDARIVGMLNERITGLARLVDELLVFARPRPPQVTRIRVRDFLDGIAEVTWSDPRFSTVELRLHVDDPDLTVRADPTQLHPVLLNLLLNANQAMDGKGCVELRATPVDGGVRIIVHDDGPGIPEEVRRRIFEPFFTTKTRGSGLGLAVAAQMMEALDGRLELVDSQQGARFELFFPR